MVTPRLLISWMVLKIRLHQRRGEAQRRLVEEQQAGAGHQGAGDRQHLLLAARKRSGHLPGALLQARKEREAALHVLRDALDVAPQEGAELQVLGDGQVGKDAAALRRVAEPARDAS